LSVVGLPTIPHNSHGPARQPTTITFDNATGNRSGPHALLEHLHYDVPVLMAERGQTPGFEEELIMLAQPLAGLEEFFLEQAAIEAHLLEHLLAQLHHLPSVVHHHISSFGGVLSDGRILKKPDEGKWIGSNGLFVDQDLSTVVLAWASGQGTNERMVAVDRYGDGDRWFRQGTSLASTTCFTTRASVPVVGHT
jgi:hypothetical protein